MTFFCNFSRPNLGQIRVSKSPMKKITMGSTESEAAEAMAKELKCILLLKGHGTVITDGETTYINPTGNPGMAKGGSGDVLSGMVLSLLGQRMEPFSACCNAVYLHGLAGDLAAQEKGERGMTPTDLLEKIPAALLTVEK